jgi:hypothetical protein
MEVKAKVCDERHRRIDEFMIRQDHTMDALRVQLTQVLSMITDLRLALQAAQARNVHASDAQQIEIDDLPRTRKIPGPILYIGGGAGVGLFIEAIRSLFAALGKG